MMLDTSALVAILAKEPDYELYINAISRARRCRISAGNLLGTLHRPGRSIRSFDLQLWMAGLERLSGVAAITKSLVELARAH